MARNTETNSYKALHGANAQQTLNDVVEQLKTYGAIAENKPTPAMGTRATTQHNLTPTRRSLMPMEARRFFTPPQA